jgi:hypothetical protein
VSGACRVLLAGTVTTEAQRAFSAAITKHSTAGGAVSSETANLFNAIAENMQGALSYWASFIYNGGAVSAIGGGWARAGAKAGYGGIEGDRVTIVRPQALGGSYSIWP